MDQGIQARGAGPSHRAVEIGVAIAMTAFGLIVIAGSVQVGIGWGVEGPRSGFIPFYLGVLIIAASGANLIEVIGARSNKTFADWSQLRQVLSVVIPTAVYVAIVPWVGIYASSVLLITVFMIWLGSYRVHFALSIAVTVMVATYLTFEKWFLVPLPKGLIEDLLGL